MPNHLSQENSPYLLQHAENPVEWYPWGEEALSRARQEDKPIFLSIGYAACHWCHVMAHESFEDENTANYLNRHFINIKVDREERPDLDAVYMNAVVSITGQGGWPMSLFLTPEGKPFFGGTYFPPRPRSGMPAFLQVLQSVIQSWQTERASIENMSQRLIDHIDSSAKWKSASVSLKFSILDDAENALLKDYDWQNGGWGRVPKFPQAMAIDFLLKKSTRGETTGLKAACHALDAMSQGGIYDLVSGGFHRYSTDAAWLVPHFEKMLYDNALLASAYLHAYLISRNPHYRLITEQTLDFILAELTDPSGGFYSSLDADTAGIEGLTYTWTYSELSETLGSSFDLFRTAFGITPQGNYEGKIILKQARSNSDLAGEFGVTPEEADQMISSNLKTLQHARRTRQQPAIDDKILAGWNGLALKSFAEAARYLDREEYLEAARKNADFLLRNLFDGQALQRSWREGKARHPAALDDYASLGLGLLSLYQVSPEDRWYKAAENLAVAMIQRFAGSDGGFFDSQADPNLPVRPKEYQDNATPSGNSLAVQFLLTLSDFSEHLEYRDMAEEILGTVQQAASEYPTAFGFWLQALDYAIGPISQIALLTKRQDNPSEMLTVLQEKYDPRSILALSMYPPSLASPAILQDRPLLNDSSTAYVCRKFICNMPVNTPVGFRKQLENPVAPG